MNKSVLDGIAEKCGLNDKEKQRVSEALVAYFGAASSGAQGNTREARSLHEQYLEATAGLSHAGWSVFVSYLVANPADDDG